MGFRNTSASRSTMQVDDARTFLHCCIDEHYPRLIYVFSSYLQDTITIQDILIGLILRKFSSILKVVVYACSGNLDLKNIPSPYHVVGNSGQR